MLPTQLKLIRLNSGFSPQIIADTLSISYDYYYAMEAGRRKIRTDVATFMQRLANREQPVIILLADNQYKLRGEDGRP